jgi:hypothetical protein
LIMSGAVKVIGSANLNKPRTGPRSAARFAVIVAID